MAIKYRGYKYSWQFFKNSTGASTQIPAASITILTFKQGARISGTITGSAGAQTIPVYDTGSIQVGDTICLDTTTGTTAVVGSITATTIVTSSGGLLASSGTRVVCVSGALTGYVDDQLSSTAGTLITGSTGGAEAYFHEPVMDCYISGTGITTQILADYTGSGIWPVVDYFGIKADNSNSDTQALRGAIGRAIAKGQQLIELPAGTIIIDNALTVTGATGLKIKGKGRGVTKLKMTTDGANLFTIGSGTTDFILEDLDLAGSGSARTASLICETSTNVSGTSIRRARLIDAGEGITLLGSDPTVDDVLFSGTRWVYALNINGATRAHIRALRGRFGATCTTGIIVQGAHSGLLLEGLDIGFTAGSAAALSFAGTGVDAHVTNSRFSGGSSAPGVLLLAGNTTMLTNVISTGSSVGFYISGGTNNMLIGCQASLNQNEGYYILGSASHTALNGCKSSDANQSNAGKYHCNIAGTISDVSIWDLEVGRFTGGSISAAGGVVLDDGAGTRIRVEKVYGETAGFAGDYVTNNKVATRTGIYVHGHGAANDTSGTAYTPEHSGFTMVAREFSSGTTLNVDGVNHLQLSYAAPATVTNFTGGYPGQLLYVTCVDGFSTVTFDHNTALIVCANSVDYALTSGNTAVFLKTNTTNQPWKQMVVGTSPVIF